MRRSGGEEERSGGKNSRRVVEEEQRRRRETEEERWRTSLNLLYIMTTILVISYTLAQTKVCYRILLSMVIAEFCLVQTLEEQAIHEAIHYYVVQSMSLMHQLILKASLH